jgi:hypothetical protein
MLLDRFREVWCVDFEFSAPDGERPSINCMVAREYRSKRLIRLWRDELERLDEAPFDVGPNSLFIAYYASAELGCFLILGWRLPARVLDLFVEFRRFTNGHQLINGNSLLGALAYFGLDAIDLSQKEEMRQLSMRGGEYTAGDRLDLLDYCQIDVDVLIVLLSAMLLIIDSEIGRACLRGRYMKAAAMIEHAGIPIDVQMLNVLRAYWPQIQLRLVDRVDRDYGVHDGTHFKFERFAAYLVRHGIPWPRTESGRLATDDDTFREMAKSYPAIAPLHELRATLGQLRLNDLAVGSDGRNRTILSAFQARSSRNAPSSKRFVFGPAVWIRYLIRPQPGYSLRYLDFASEEFAIGAGFSGDAAMQHAYLSGDRDPYLAFAKQVGAIPPDGTRQNPVYEATRNLFKTVCLGINYGMGPNSLAQRIGRPLVVARQLLQLHRATYRDFWRWSDGAVDHALQHGCIETVFGWKLQVGSEPNERSLRNFPLQANGAELLRFACCLATERGVTVCAPVHDALLIEAPTDDIEHWATVAVGAMREASRIVLNGFELRVDVKSIDYPNRFDDPRGQVMWNTVCAILRELGAAIDHGYDSIHVSL